MKVSSIGSAFKCLFVVVVVVFVAHTPSRKRRNGGRTETKTDSTHFYRIVNYIYRIVNDLLRTVNDIFRIVKDFIN